MIINLCSYVKQYKKISSLVKMPRNDWIEALMKYNQMSQHDNKWCVPMKGTDEYDFVKKLQKQVRKYKDLQKKNQVK